MDVTAWKGGGVGGIRCLEMGQVACPPQLHNLRSVCYEHSRAEILLTVQQGVGHETISVTLCRCPALPLVRSPADFINFRV
jgi:hypothetical protein